MSSPRAQRQSPPQNRKAALLKTFWRRFCLGPKRLANPGLGYSHRHNGHTHCN